MSLSLTHDQLFEFLAQKKKNPIFQKETGQNFILLKMHGQDIHVFFVILSEGKLLQVIGYYPFVFLDQTLSDLARFLHLLNKEVDMPGFGLDEKEKLIFYRVVIPCFENKFDPNLLESYLNTLQLALEKFYAVIGTIASGQAKLDDLIEEAKKALSQGEMRG